MRTGPRADRGAAGNGRPRPPARARPAARARDPRSARPRTLSTGRVLIADHRGLIRESLRLVLERSGLEVAGTASDGLSAVDRAARLRPDVLVVDEDIPRLSSFDVARRLARREPPIHTVILADRPDAGVAWRALEAGASAFVTREQDGVHLCRAVREAMAGRRYIGPPLTEHEVEEFGRGARRGTDPIGRVTEREREVIQLTAEGMTSTEIGRRLAISPRTVEVHRSNAMRKLGLRGRTQLIHFALAQGLVPNSVRKR